MSIAEEKQVLRTRMKLLMEEKNESSCSLSSLLKLTAWADASSLLLYAPLPGEADLRKLLVLFPEKKFSFPRIRKKQLHLYEWFSQAPWITNSYGLEEPDSEYWREIPLTQIDLAMIPGLAFDWRGGRLGRGGGFYDRLLSQPGWHALNIGVAWPWQIVNAIPRNEQDVLMDVIVTLSSENH